MIPLSDAIPCQMADTLNRKHNIFIDIIKRSGSTHKKNRMPIKVWQSHHTICKRICYEWVFVELAVSVHIQLKHMYLSIGRETERNETHLHLAVCYTEYGTEKKEFLNTLTQNRKYTVNLLATKS